MNYINRFLGIRRKEPWECSVSDGPPSSATLDALVDALIAKQDAEHLVRVLSHVEHLAVHSEANKSALITGGVSIIVFHKASEIDNKKVFESAIAVAAVLCRGQPAVCSLAVKHGLVRSCLLGWQQYHVQDPLTAASCASLLQLLFTSCAATCAAFTASGGCRVLTSILKLGPAALEVPRSQLSGSEVAGQPLVEKPFGVLLLKCTLLCWTATATSEQSLAEEMGSEGVVTALLGLIPLARSLDLQEGCLGALEVLTAQNSLNRLRLCDAGGVPIMLSLLSSSQLPWSVRTHAAAVLEHVSLGTTSSVRVVRLGGLDLAFHLLNVLLGLSQATEVALQPATAVAPSMVQPVPGFSPAILPQSEPPAIAPLTPLDQNPMQQGIAARSILKGKSTYTKSRHQLGGTVAKAAGGQSIQAQSTPASPGPPQTSAASVAVPAVTAYSDARQLPATTTSAVATSTPQPSSAAADAVSRLSPSDRTSACEDLLAIVRALASDPAHMREFTNPSRIRTLVAALNAGMRDFRSTGYTLALGSAEVFAQLSSQRTLLDMLARSEILTPLANLTERGIGSGACKSTHDAMIVHAAWCAGTVSLALLTSSSSSSGGSTQGTDVLSANTLPNVVALLTASGTALGYALGTLPSAPAKDSRVSHPGYVYLCTDRVAALIKSATASLVRHLHDRVLSASEKHDHTSLAAMHSWGVVNAFKLASGWQHTRWPAKRALHVLGEGDSEYQPFVRYKDGMLQQALAVGGIPPGPFTARAVDAHLLLNLSEGYLRHDMRLDELTLMKVRGLQSAHAMFMRLDSADLRIDGCIYMKHMAEMLTNEVGLRPGVSEDLSARVWRESGAQPCDPICFLQFLACYPWLSSEINALSNYSRVKRPSLGPLPNGE